MKVNELMIGDWVQVPCLIDNTENYNAWCQIRQLRDGDLDVIGFKELSYDEICPIPLTPEILEKNGFIIKKKWAQIGNFGDNPLIMWHFEDDAFLHDFKHELEIHQNDTGKVHIRIPCEYVHELQHALRLCRIDKTIEL